MRPVKLTEQQIDQALSTVPQWERVGDTIKCQYEFTDFVAAMTFVNALASEAERAQHHPDINIRYNKVTLALSTHDVGGLTKLDFDLARFADQVKKG